MYSFDELWNKFNKKLLNFINSKVNNIHDAEDILQDVFIKIFNKIDQLESKVSTKAWIFTITRNTIIDFYKKRKDFIVSPNSLNIVVEELEDINEMNDDISKCISNMIYNLPDKYNQVYNMHEKQGMKHKDISKTLDISISASKVRLKRVKDKIKESLLGCCDFKVDEYGNILKYDKKDISKICNDC